MAGKVFQCTLMFGATDTGWSETWYHAPGSPPGAGPATYDTAMEALEAYAAKRAATIGLGTQIVALRVSDVDVYRDRFRKLKMSLPQDEPAVALVRDNPTNSWLFEVSSQRLYWRQLWLRGLPDAWIVWDNVLGKYTPVPDLAKITKGLLDTLKKGFLCLKVSLKDAAPMPLGNVAINGVDRTVGYTVLGAISSLNVGDRISVRGVKGLTVPPETSSGSKQVNISGTVIAITGQVVTVRAPKPFTLPFTYLNGGQLYRRATGYALPDDIQPNRPSSRRTGRPFFAPVGRRRARA